MAYYTPEQLEKMRASLKRAKDNPADPKSREIFKRINEGKMNFELQALGIEPVKVERPKINMAEALKAGGATQIPAEDSATGGDVQRVDGELLEMPKAPSSQMGDIPQGMEQPGKTFSSGFLTPESRKETKADIKETFFNVGEELVGGVSRAFNVWAEDDLSVGNKFLTSVVQPFGGVMSAVGEAVVGLGKTVLTEESERKIGELIKEAGMAATDTELYKNIAPKVADWYEGLDPNEKATFDNAMDIGEFISEFLVIGKSLKPLKEGIRKGADIAEDGLPKVQGALEDAARKAGEVVDTSLAGKREVAIAEQSARVDEAVNRIIQKDVSPFEKEQAKRALSDINVEGIEDYGGLNQSLKDNITSLSKKVDQELEKYPDVISKDEWTKTTQVGGESIVQNPLADALDGLETAYTKSGDLVEAAEIRLLREKFNTEGLTVREANDLARQYGIEFRDRAFTKLGDPKMGYNAENYENVRKGVKEAVRDKMPDETTKLLDQKMSDTYTTLDLTRKMETKANQLRNRLADQGIIQKLGGVAADVADMASFGVLRGFLSKMSGGKTTLNAIEIEKELAKNLAEIDTMLKMKSDASFADAFEDYMKNLPVGMSIKDVSSRNASQTTKGKSLRVVKYTDSNGKKQSMEMEADEVRDFTNRLDDKGIEYEIDTKASSFNEGANPSTTKYIPDEKVTESTPPQGRIKMNDPRLVPSEYSPQEIRQGSGATDRGLKIDELKSILAEGGDLTPIRVRLTTDAEGDFYEVVDGHHRLAAYEEMGREDIPFIWDEYSVNKINKRDELLDGWVTRDVGEKAPDFTLEQIKEFEALNLPKGIEEPTTLYRAGDLATGRISSWTSNPDIAEMHAEVNGGDIMERVVSPDEVLVSLTDLSPELKKKYHVIEDEEEFLLKPLTD